MSENDEDGVFDERWLRSQLRFSFATGTAIGFILGMLAGGITAFLGVFRVCLS